MNKFAYSVLIPILSLICVAGVEAETNGPQVKDAAFSIFRQMDVHFSSIGTLQYTASRTISMGQKKLNDKWSFTFQAPSLFRLHYIEPQERIIVANDEFLWEYIPEAKRAMRTDLSKLTEAAKNKLIVGIVGRVSLDGLRVGQYEDLVKRATVLAASTNDAALVTIAGEGPRYSISVDTNRQVLVQSEVFNEAGEIILRTKASDFRQVAPGFWYPHALDLIQGTPDGFALSRVSLKDVKINEPTSAETFRFDKPKNVKVVQSGG